jgi:hypothetical protein
MVAASRIGSPFRDRFFQMMPRVNGSSANNASSIGLRRFDVTVEIEKVTRASSAERAVER